MSVTVNTEPAIVGPRPGIQEGGRRRSGRTATRNSPLTSVWFLLPLIAVFVILILIPLIYSLVWSFSDFNAYTGQIGFVGLANYATIFSDPSLLTGLGFTLLFAITTTLVITVIAIPLALTLNAKFFGRNFARALFFFLGVPSLAILGLVWRYIFSPLDSGVVNSVLTHLGLSGLPWLADPQLARFAVIFVAVWAGTGWHATLYLAFLQAIPADLYEQAVVDGANARQRFTNITLPMLVPGIAISTFLLMTAGLKVYELPFTLTKGGPGYATATITQSIIQRGIAQSDFGVGSALAVIFTLATCIVVAIQVVASNALSRRFS